MSAAPLTLLADLGGTNVRFALSSGDVAQPLIADSVRRYKVSDFPSFTDAARRYLSDIHAQPSIAVFAVAGLVVGDDVRITNVPWVISGQRVKSDLDLAALHLINDFQAMSLSLPLLQAGKVLAIGDQPAPRLGAEAEQMFAIVGPGTGLGVGGLLVRHPHVYALNTEGGHMSFAPGNELEIEILRRLAARFGRVSNERLLCGSGLVNLYRALCDIEGVEAALPSPEAITESARNNASPQSVQAVDLFCELLGAVAGDLVLGFGSWQGVYLTGGLTPLLLPWLQRGGFRERFQDKGRHSQAMHTVPTLAVLETDAGLMGAAAAGIQANGGSLLVRREGVAV